ncbi:MAG: hypothetical protein MK066_03350 [Crocinitomicaceae bacterium]|nr:hypothetical protein [Crocinitomicaceae bacterium]
MESPRHPLLKLRREPTEEIISLLESVTLGTNGAQYRHLDTRSRINEVDEPIYLSLERNERILGNVTFCQRKKHWYVRYFAFQALLPTTGKEHSSSKNSKLKTALNGYFDDVLSTIDTGGGIDAFYAYIDPRNSKSVLLSQTIGFEKLGSVITQTFSRRRPKSSKRVARIIDWSRISEIHKKQNQSRLFYFENQSCKPPFYIIENEYGQVIAFAKIHIANWHIKRLPGRFGGVLVKLIPWIPIIGSLIKPNKHSFIVPEGVYVKDDDPELLNELFEGILALEKKKVLIWWVDPRESNYLNGLNRLKWGILDRIIGRNMVDVVVRTNTNLDKENLFYVSGFDFI